jgi:hypothetical protein
VIDFKRAPSRRSCQWALALALWRPRARARCRDPSLTGTVTGRLLKCGRQLELFERGPFLRSDSDSESESESARSRACCAPAASVLAGTERAPGLGLGPGPGPPQPWAAFPSVSPRLAPTTTLQPSPLEQRREPLSSGADGAGPRAERRAGCRRDEGRQWNTPVEERALGTPDSNRT